MDRAPLGNHAADAAGRPRPVRASRDHPLAERVVRPAVGDVLIVLAVIQPEQSEARAAKPCRVLQDGAEYRLNIGWRSADDLQDIRRRRLPLERLLGLVE